MPRRRSRSTGLLRYFRLLRGLPLLYVWQIDVSSHQWINAEYGLRSTGTTRFNPRLQRTIANVPLNVALVEQCKIAASGKSLAKACCCKGKSCNLSVFPLAMPTTRLHFPRLLPNDSIQHRVASCVRLSEQIKPLSGGFRRV